MTAALDAATLRVLLESGDPPRLIDVRTPGEFETAHLPGSRNVPLDLLREHRDEVRAHLDERAVLLCASGQRAETAGRLLAEAGLPGLRVLSGGVGAWRAEGGQVTTGRPRWSLERQVRLTAGGIVLGSVVTSAVLPRAKWVAAAIGGGLTFAAVSDTCAMGSLLARLPYNRGPRTDIAAVLATLADARP
ncbi:rhodanese-like domain-containing protein [Spongiactinospora sp. TRM90649]|uniref:rhodanese-like domain-containing protein n=1 Tax=Spongiactinospora sp. TRM90649 TaxID=3031114 RepID=UPI0023F64B40|nr:rhodanese-like domain-containing protein [Spongiactinospora sp. TRM90649]MDF5757672.1 rhodanese-like domain-containing protein [Spongiactinospora sp. TRM90649]